MFWHGNKQIIRMFRDGNVIVGGHKGRGKDLLFQYVIARREKDGEIHAANIYYTDKTTIRPIDYYKLHNNGYSNFVSGKFNIEDKAFIEKEDFYISDIGTALPGQYHAKLDKEYPTLPIVYALSRHLADFSIHCNCQNFNRVWDKLREQADYYIWCERAKVLFGRLALQWVVCYTEYGAAVQHIQPFECRRRLLGLLPPHPEDIAAANTHNAKYGSIRRYFFWHILPKKHYDTREFHKKIYGKEAPKIDKRKHRKKKTTDKNTSEEKNSDTTAQ